MKHLYKPEKKGRLAGKKHLGLAAALLLLCAVLLPVEARAAENATPDLRYDFNGNKAESVEDMQRLYEHLCGTNALTGDALAAADCNGDGAVNILDYQMCYKYLLCGTHSYKDTVTAPTCTEKGYTTHTCTRCGDSYRDTYVDALGHDYGVPVWEWSADGHTATATSLCANDAAHKLTQTVTLGSGITGRVATPSDCTEKGCTVYTATVTLDGNTYTSAKSLSDIPALGHTPVTDAAVAATCTETGLTEGSHCSRCGAVLKKQEAIPAVGHIAAVDAAKTPTCTETGLTEGSHCSVCGAVLTAQQSIAKLGHCFGEPVWTWDAGGQYATVTLTCTRDAGHMLTQTVECSSSVTTEATCTESGTITYTATATLNGKEYTGTHEVSYTAAEEKGHNYSTAVWDWAENGQSAVVTRTCTYNPSHKLSETVSLSAGTITGVTYKDATCEEKGITAYSATVTLGGQSFTDTKKVEDIPRKGHLYDQIQWAWNESKITATYSAVCKNDSSHTESGTLTPENGITSRVATPSDCTAMGTHTYTATVTLGGITHTATRNITDIAPLGHSYGTVQWTWSEDCHTATAYHTCSCGHTEQEAASMDNGEIEVVKQKAATDDSDGFITYKATVVLSGKICTDEKTVTLPSPGHSYGAPSEWEWSADGKTAAAVFACTHSGCCNEIRSQATVSVESEKAATCTEGGTVTYKAEVTLEGSGTYIDRKTITVSDATGHGYGAPAWEWSVDGHIATATSLCTNDNEHKLTETVTLEQHKITSEVATPSDCTQWGYTAYTATVTLDGETYTNTRLVQDREPLGHNYTSEVTAPKCTAEGCTTHTCSRCGDSYEDTYVKPLGHTTVTDLAVAPTCTESGLTAGIHCSLCGAVLKEQEVVPALGHEYGDPVWEWSDDGHTATATRTCSHDATHQLSATVTLDSGIISAVTKSAACTEKGTTRYTATVTLNGKTYTDTKDVTDIPATGHSWSAVTYVWAADGSSCTATRTCKNDASHKETATATNIAGEVSKAAACTTAGDTTYTASFAESWASTQTKTVTGNVPATGHSYASTVTDPTCTTQGCTAHTCSRCGDSYTDTFVDALGHSCGEPTWEWSADGHTATATSLCTQCKENQVKTLTPGSGITSVIKTPATCEAAGTTAYTATVTLNGTTYTDTKDVVDIPAIGHKWSATIIYEWAEDYSSCTATRICENNSAHTETATAAVTGEVTRAATCTTAGDTTYTASFAESWASTQTKTVTGNVPATGHTYVKGYCTVCHKSQYEMPEIGL